MDPIFRVHSIEIIDKGTSLYKGAKLGPVGVGTEDAAAFAFQVKIDGWRRNGKYT